MRDYNNSTLTWTFKERVKILFQDLIDLRLYVKQKNRARGETFLDCIADCFNQKHLS